ncbi:MAG TPA: patatin-like phospholipase family protein [bacterium]|nr:patatin-like phospholipase family protein [bacterium]
MPNLSTAGYALVLPGEAMWGAFQTGFANQMADQLRDAGYGQAPYRATVGSSSGSLVATALAGGPVAHDFARSCWIEFGRAARFRPWELRNPYPAALQQVFDRGLIDIEKAYQSPTQIILTAAHYNPEDLASFGRGWADLVASGVGRVFKRGRESASALQERAADLMEEGGKLFSPRFFTNKPKLPPSAEGSEDWTVVKDSGEMRKAVEASSRIPFLYGNPIENGAELLIDGVFANNAPVHLALETGARHVFIVTSSKSGNVFDRPVQSILKRSGRKLLGRTGLCDLLSGTRPLDLDALRERYPGQEIHVVHPDKEISVNRFFETDASVFSALYDMGVRMALQHRHVVTRPTGEEVLAAE